MKNKEKFADEIIDLLCTSKDPIAVNFKGEIVRCHDIFCKNCKFHKEGDCITAARKWLEEEYGEPPVISHKDALFLQFIKDNYKYIARGYSGNLFLLYTYKPAKGIGSWSLNSSYVSIDPFDVCFPMVKWEDEEPWAIKDLMKLKVVNEYERTKENEK